ncbi:MAG: hydrogenase maturation nickel metallochaperone HypA [Candidatus Pacebacteria bacterium]|nr:hydrogenase maturation nickel metallochaperone HypA [Candidatus Paceibacterota bacterium]
MHDLHLADKILKTALEYAQKNGLKKITSIKIELGDIVEHGERILPENLEFNFQLLAKNTIAQNAKLKIFSTKGEIWRLLEIEGE